MLLCMNNIKTWYVMKKRNFKLLKLKKYKISKLNMLTNYGGDAGNGETTSVGSDTLPSILTAVNCEETETCNTKGPITCQTTGTLVENTYNDTCDCAAIVSLGC